MKFLPGIFLLVLCASCTEASRPVVTNGAFMVSPDGITGLQGTWKARAADSPVFADPGYDDGGWDDVRVPGNLMELYPGHSGIAWYRADLRFKDGQARPHTLILGRISDADEAYFNGERIGSTGSIDDVSRHGFDRTRVYYIPERLVKPGASNVLAVRVRGYLGDSAGLIWGVYEIGPLGAMQRHIFSDLALDVLFMGIYIFIAAFFLIFSMMPTALAWAQRRFALVALAHAVYIFCAGQVKYLFTDHFFTFHLAQYITGMTATIVIIPLFRRLFSREPGLADRIIMALLGCAAASLFFIPEIRDWTIPRLVWNAAILYIAATGMVHIIVSLARRRWDLVFVDAGFAVISVAVIFEVLRANNMAPDFDYLRFGLAGLMISIAFFLADQLNIIRQIEARAIAELEGKVEARTREVRARNEAIERQLEIARLIQSKLMPAEPPCVPGFAAYAVCMPMDKVGGDFYDYHDGDGLIRGIIADVSGHGVPGAFLALITKMAFQTFVATGLTNSGLMEELNKSIFQATVLSHFVTVCLYSIDKKTGALSYASAGHVSPILYRRNTGKSEELEARGRPLGWHRDLRVEERETSLSHGDRILFFTDGVTECRNARGDFFGTERLMEFMRSSAHQSAQECARSLIRDLRDFSGRKEFEDDITYVVVDMQ